MTRGCNFFSEAMTTPSLARKSASDDKFAEKNFISVSNSSIASKDALISTICNQ